MQIFYIFTNDLQLFLLWETGLRSWEEGGGALEGFSSILNGEKHVSRSWPNQCLDWISNFVEIAVTHSFSQSTSIGGILGPIVLV